MNFFHLLSIVFAVAKLAGYFPHSWWIVFLPSIIRIAVGLAILLFGLLIVCVAND